MRPDYPPAFDIVVDFICEKGMTFRDLIDSEYNISLTPISSSTYEDLRLYFDIIRHPINNNEIIYCRTTGSTTLSDTSLVAKLDDIIIENTTYETT